MKITRLQIMLPYFNDIYEVGKPIQIYNQVSDPTTEKRRVEMYGVIESIRRVQNAHRVLYRISFESGEAITLADTPALVEYESVKEVAE